MPEPPPEQGEFISGEVLRYRNFPSKTLGNDRDVWVYLPPSYREHPERRYPVLYLQDGQNVFDAATSAFGTEWRLDETAEQLIRQGKLPELIMVAPANTPERMAEYTSMPDPEYGGGRAAGYGRFMVEELKPFIDSRYRTRIEAAATGVMGSSLGGLVSLYLGWNYPHVFGLVGALSPSLWWANKAGLEEVAAAPGPGPSRLWLDGGTAEGKDLDGNGRVEMIDDTLDLAHRLVDKGWTRDNWLFYREVEGGQHNEASWAARAGEALVALYGPLPGPESVNPSTPAMSVRAKSSPLKRSGSSA